MNYEFLWYISNTVEAGHRLAIVTGGRRAWSCPPSPARILEDHDYYPDGYFGS